MSKPSFGSYIVLKRHFCLPFFPKDEAGPSAIVADRRVSFLGAATVASCYLNGRSHARWMGITKGSAESVLVISPFVPDLALVDQLLNVDITWQAWNGEALPETDADVVIVWLPKRALPKMTLPRIAERLVAEAFGSGAVYSVDGLEEQIKACEVRHA